MGSVQIEIRTNLVFLLPKFSFLLDARDLPFEVFGFYVNLAKSTKGEMDRVSHTK